jgi:peptidoglycan/LPS O-acetylase OafA/YrhL
MNGGQLFCFYLIHYQQVNHFFIFLVWPLNNYWYQGNKTGNQKNNIMQNFLSSLKCGPGLFRFILAFVVVIYHTVGAFPLGHFAVYVFFMLSGYWIFKMFEEKYSSYKNAYLVYIKSRLLRVIFIYWLVLLVGIIVFFVAVSITQSDSWQQFSMTEIVLKNVFILGINQSPIMFVVPAWSLEVEIQFYLLAPVLVLLRPYISIQWLLVAAVAAMLLYIQVVPLQHRVSNIVLYLPFFLIGAWLYYSHKLFSAKTANFGLWLGVLVIAVNVLVPSLRAGFLTKTAPLFGAHHYQDQINIVLAFLTLPYLSRNITQKETSSFDGTWSSMSFVLYLLHWPLLKIYYTLLYVNGNAYKAIFFGGYFIVSVALSYFISVTADRYFENIRRNWLKKQTKASVPTDIPLQPQPAFQLVKPATRMEDRSIR